MRNERRWWIYLGSSTRKSAVLDMPASLDLSIMDLSFRISLLIGLSPPDIRAQKLSSAEVVECNKDQ
jgi:hypothetical protein